MTIFTFILVTNLAKHINSVGFNSLQECRDYQQQFLIAAQQNNFQVIQSECKQIGADHVEMGTKRATDSKG